MIKIRDPRSLIYSDDSVLERHHAYTTFKIIHSSSESRNIFCGLGPSEETEVRKLIIKAILGTDMKHQRDHVKALDLHAPRVPKFDKENAAERQTLVEILVHVGDLGAQTYKTPLALKWGDRCLEEFIQQAQMEQVKGVPVTTFMVLSTESR